MPFKRTSKKKLYKKKSRTSKRRFTKRRKGFSMGKFVSTLPGFPAQKVVKLRYCEFIQSTLNGVGYALYQYVANGCFDPNVAAGGHQPIGFDQWSTFYNHYAVLGSRISVKVTGADNSANGASLINVCLSDDTTISTDIQQLVEYGMGSTKMTSGWTGNSGVTLSCNYSAKKFFNIKDVKDNIPRIGAAINANPADTAIFNITVQSEPSMTIERLVVIEYIVMFSEPKELPSS